MISDDDLFGFFISEEQLILSEEQLIYTYGGPWHSRYVIAEYLDWAIEVLSEVYCGKPSTGSMAYVRIGGELRYALRTGEVVRYETR